MTGGDRIKAVSYPKNKPLPMRTAKVGKKPKALRKKILPPEAAYRLSKLAEKPTGPIFATVIDSPPIDGFIPWIAVAVTDERISEEEMIFEATPVDYVIGSYLTSNPQANYAVGVFDTGASAHVMGHSDAAQAGLSGSYLTSNTVEITGVTGSATAWVSQPIGIFIDGIGAIEPNGMLQNTSGMVGETNTAIAVGQNSTPDLITAIGAPLSVYFAAEFRNEWELTITHNTEDFNGPDIFLYDYSEPCLPAYDNIMPLELRPLGGVSVQYIPLIDLFNPFSFPPASPSTIIGNFSQSVFFVASVDLYEGNKSAIDKTRFMLDTGAQITVVGSRIAARLGLNPADPNFEVEIQGVTGDSIIVPGFYIDTIEIPALGEWLSFTNIPVVLLDVASPEGGTLDGIIGMNLFLELNFLLRGGGLFGTEDPRLEFGPIPYHIAADITPRGGDNIVDSFDLTVFTEAWLSTKEPSSSNWDSRCDLAPAAQPDGKVDFLDFAVFAQHWRETTP
jgi:predicted aspartyl protease